MNWQKAELVDSRRLRRIKMPRKKDSEADEGAGSASGRSVDSQSGGGAGAKRGRAGARERIAGLWAEEEQRKDALREEQARQQRHTSGTGVTSTFIRRRACNSH